MDQINKEKIILRVLEEGKNLMYRKLPKETKKEKQQLQKKN